MDKYELLDKANKFRALFVKKFVDLGVPIDKIKSPMTEVEGKYFFEVDIVNWNFCCQIFSYKYQNEKGQIVSNTFNECRFTDSFGNDFDTEINEELINLYILDVLVPEELG